MKRLNVKIKNGNNTLGNNEYDNSVNGENFKDVAMVLMDLSNHNIPIKKAYKEYLRLINNDWNFIIGE